MKQETNTRKRHLTQTDSPLEPPRKQQKTRSKSNKLETILNIFNHENVLNLDPFNIDNNHENVFPIIGDQQQPHFIFKNFLFKSPKSPVVPPTPKISITDFFTNSQTTTTPLSFHHLFTPQENPQQEEEQPKPKPKKLIFNIIKDEFKTSKFTIQHRAIILVQVNKRSLKPDWWTVQSLPSLVAESGRRVGSCNLFLLRSKFGRYKDDLVNDQYSSMVNITFGMKIFHWFASDLVIERVDIGNNETMITILHKESGICFDLRNFVKSELDKVEERLRLGVELDLKSKKEKFDEDYLLKNKLEFVPVSDEERLAKLKLRKFYWSDKQS